MVSSPLAFLMRGGSINEVQPNDSATGKLRMMVFPTTSQRYRRCCISLILDKVKSELFGMLSSREIGLKLIILVKTGESSKL
ncbi:uncharacterized protein IAS62_005959 [Cryptococcus decagattii]|uniref:Uncharacterized protein n=1 Tax=Cryptococcus decagattii TaxID=1859122 RepID=A0ABZ2B4H1_9TREE